MLLHHRASKDVALKLAPWLEQLHIMATAYVCNCPCRALKAAQLGPVNDTFQKAAKALVARLGLNAGLTSLMQTFMLALQVGC